MTTYGIPDGTMVHFRLPRRSQAAEAAIADMQRYASARDAIVTDLDDGRRYVSLLFDKTLRREPAATVARARSFGWSRVDWEPGLPPAPIRIVERRPPPRRTRIGRPFQWLQTIIFDQQPADATIAEVVRIGDPNMQRGVINEQTSCGVWEVSIWRDRGWTRTEHAEFWQQVNVLGGRQVRDGDFGCNRSSAQTGF